MKVLVLADNDSDNVMISNVIKELLKRNINVKIYSRLTDVKSIRMFCELGLSVTDSRKLTEEIVEWADVILSTLRAHINFNLLGEKIFCKKYIFVYNNYIDNTWYTPGADFMFTCGYTRHMRHMEDCASMPIGCPKNDREPNNHIIIEKKILFIDSGHYPFSHKGKIQIADMLIKICRMYPDYTLTIKPRFLPTDTNLLHANYDHIYSLIDERCNGKIPDNLIMLFEHKDMQDMLDGCCCAIMLCTSAYIDAALKGKNMIIVNGIDNEDKFELRNDIEYKNVYELRKESGCLVDINEVFEYLPNGIACREEHLNQVVAYRTNASKKMVDVMKYIYDKFLVKNEFPDIRGYCYETYKTEMTSSSKLCWDVLLHKRIKNIANDGFNYLNRVTVECDYSELYDFVDREYINYPVNTDGLKEFLDKFDEIRKKIWIKEKEKFMYDPLNQAELFKALYEANKYALLTEIKKEEILCEEVWNFYMGRITFQEKSYQKSWFHLKKFILTIRDRNFAKYACEEWFEIRNIYISFAEMFDFIDVTEKEYAELYIILFRKRAENGLPYSQRKKLWEIARKGCDQLYQDKDWQAVAECMRYCTSESGLFREEREQLDDLRKEYDNIRNSISYQLGMKITWLPRKLRKLVKEFVHTNFIRTLRDKYLNTLFCRMNHEFYKNIIEGYHQYCLLIKEHGEDAYLHLGASGTGDIYISGLYYNSYISYKNRKNTAVYVLPGESCNQVARLFDIEHTKKISKEEWTKLLHILRFMGEPQVRIDLLYYHIFTVYTGYVTWLEGFRGWNLYSLMKEIHFPMLKEKDMELPKFNNQKKIIEKILEETKLKIGRTVILAPYAKWSPNIIGDFWEVLSEKLTKKGYTVCTNSIGEEEPPIKGSIALSFPYDIAVPLVETAGYIVGLRSGFLDIIESAGAKKVSLYPYNCVRRGIADSTAMGSFSLNEMFQRHDWLELETRPSNLSEVIDKILTYFEE